MDELYWAAGFFDGEGTTVCVRNGKHRRLMVTITQVRREPLDRFQNAVCGLGRIHGPYQRTDSQYNVQPHYTYQCQAANSSRAVIAMLRPLVCSIKREQMDAALKAFDEYQAGRVERDRSAEVAKGWITRRANLAKRSAA